MPPPPPSHESPTPLRTRQTVLLLTVVFSIAAAHLLLSTNLVHNYLHMSLLDANSLPTPSTQHDSDLSTTRRHTSFSPVSRLSSLNTPPSAPPDGHHTLNTAGFSQSHGAEEDIVHTLAQMQPDLHTKAPATVECTCASASARRDDMLALKDLKRQHESLPPPQRVALSSAKQASVPGSTLLKPDVFQEVYVINLPTRADRHYYMCRQMQQLGADAILWPAFTKVHKAVVEYKRNLHNVIATPAMWDADVRNTQPAAAGAEDENQPPPEEEAEPPPSPKSKKVPRWRKKRLILSYGAVACGLSHREVWHDIVQKKLAGPVLIMEDDVDMEADFSNILANALKRIPADWKLFFVGSCFEEIVPHNETSKVAHRIHKALNPTCTHAYALRDADAASFLLEQLGHDMVLPVDLGMQHIIRKFPERLPTYVMLPPPVTQLWRTKRPRALTSNAESNPSDVMLHGMKLPQQKIVRSLRSVIVEQDAKLHPDVDPAQRLCGNELFYLNNSGAPPELAHYEEPDYAPR